MEESGDRRRDRAGFELNMESTPHGWKIFDADTPVLLYEYSFGPGSATALAVGGTDGLIVVSPPYRAAEGIFEDLRAYGPVPEWKRRFPQAAIFAPAQSVARVEKKTKLSGIRPLHEAVYMTGPKLELTDMPHYRTGEVLVRIKTARGLAWYVTDIILNIQVMPKNPIIYLMFKLTGSAPGLKYNKVGPKFMVKDMAALKRWFAAEYEKDQPRWLIPTHGAIADLGAEPEEGRRLFANT
jgi:hypothetical protein